MRKLFICLISSTIIFACTREVAPVDEGLVRVEIESPQVYGFRPDIPEVKAVGDHSSILPTHQILELEEGSTLWLSYELRTAAAEGDTPATYDPPVLKAYVVRNSGGGYKALYACNHSIVNDMLIVDEDDASTTAVPLYLKHGETYRFRMLSPARPINASNLSMAVGNGESFCSSDERYMETCSSDTEINASVSGVNYIRLNPMIQQTARLKFTLKKGNNVSSIRMMGDGIEVSGIQDPYFQELEDGRKLTYNWSSLDIKDTLVMRKGDKRAWVDIPGDRFVADPEGNLTGEICILPTDARTNSVVILMNMSVNGVPTQYMTMINGMIFEHAKSYNMTFEIGLKNDIVLVNWQNVSWTEDI